MKAAGPIRRKWVTERQGRKWEYLRIGVHGFRRPFHEWERDPERLDAVGGEPCGEGENRSSLIYLHVIVSNMERAVDGLEREFRVKEIVEMTRLNRSQVNRALADPAASQVLTYPRRGYVKLIDPMSLVRS